MKHRDWLRESKKKSKREVDRRRWKENRDFMCKFMCGFGTRDHFSKGTYPDEIIPQEPKEEKYKIKQSKQNTNNYHNTT